MNNLDFWLEKAKEFCEKFELPVLKDDGSNVNMFFCADVIGGKKFVLNYAGFPRNEIAQINESATIEMQMDLMNQLVDYSPSENPNAGKTDAEIMLGHKSKYLQTPSESIRWLEDQLSRRDSDRQAAEVASKSNIDFTNTETPVENE